MKTCRIADAIGRLDDDLIEGAFAPAQSEQRKKKK